MGDIFLSPLNPINVRCMHCQKVLISVILKGEIELIGDTQLYCNGCGNLTTFDSKHILKNTVGSIR